MNLKEIINIQKKFDSGHATRFDWSAKITDDNIEMLQYLFLSLVGEFGELSNIIKKIARGDCTLEKKKNEIADEIADCFIYILKISYQLDIDLEESFLGKIKKNKMKFKDYEVKKWL